MYDAWGQAGEHLWSTTGTTDTTRRGAEPVRRRAPSDEGDWGWQRKRRTVRTADDGLQPRTVRRHVGVDAWGRG